MSAHALLLELARLHKQLAAMAAVGSARDVQSVLERIIDLRRRIDEAEVGPRCIECGRLMGMGKRWRAYVADVADDTAPPEVCVYCPDCAEREFDC